MILNIFKYIIFFINVNDILCLCIFTHKLSYILFFLYIITLELFCLFSLWHLCTLVHFIFYT